MAKVINNPVFNEFVYTVLFAASLQQKRGLPGKYLKIAMNGKAAKTFATKSSKEEKELILSHLGFETFYVVARRGMPLDKFKDILEKFETKKRVAALSDIAEAGVFVTSDREFLRLLGLMAQSIHHPSHFLNLELQRQGFHIQKWSKQYQNAEDMTTRGLEASAKLLARTCLSVALMIDSWPGATGISPLQLKILLYLYSVSHTNVSHKRLYDVFGGYTNPNSYAIAMRGLASEQLVLRIVLNREVEYAISGLGIKQINEFINRVINLNTF